MFYLKLLFVPQSDLLGLLVPCHAVLLPVVHRWEQSLVLNEKNIYKVIYVCYISIANKYRRFWHNMQKLLKHPLPWCEQSWSRFCFHQQAKDHGQYAHLLTGRWQILSLWTRILGQLFCWKERWVNMLKRLHSVNSLGLVNLQNGEVNSVFERASGSSNFL